MVLRRACVCLFLAIGPLQGAVGDIVFEGSNADLEITSPLSVGDGSENLRSVILRAVGKDGALVAGFDGDIQGILHQQSAPAAMTPTLDEPLGDVQLVTGIDTHFLVQGEQILAVPGFEPAELVGIAASSDEAPDASGPMANLAQTSFGDSISGAFARIGGGQSPWDLAQLVVPEGTAITLELELGFSGPTPPVKEIVATTFEVGATGGSDTIIQPGDANLDQEFNALDVILVLAANKYETNVVADWSDGDWNAAPDPAFNYNTGPPAGDGRFNSLDIVAALASGTYETGPFTALGENIALGSVPEPSCFAWLAIGAAMCALFRIGRSDSSQ